jgi:hypothetical protein
MTLRRGRGIVAGLGLAGAFLLSASPAVAKPCPGHHHTPAGNSEATQYSETVPGPCGDQPIGGNGGNGGGSGSTTGSNGSSVSGVPTSSITQLQGMGPAGVRAANLAEATSPLGSGGNRNGGSPGAGGGSANGSANGTGGTGTGVDGGGISDVGSPLGALASLVTGGSSGDGVGPILPILLVGLLLGGLGFLALMRARPQ